MSFAVIMVIFKIFMILMVMAIIYAEKASRKRKHPVRLMRRKLVRLEPVGLLNISSPLHPEKDVFFFFRGIDSLENDFSCGGRLRFPWWTHFLGGDFCRFFLVIFLLPFHRLQNLKPRQLPLPPPSRMIVKRNWMRLQPPWFERGKPEIPGLGIIKKKCPEHFCRLRGWLLNGFEYMYIYIYYIFIIRKF